MEGEIDEIVYKLCRLMEKQIAVVERASSAK